MVLWAARINQSQVTRETTFLLVYGDEVMLPPEIAPRSQRVEEFDEDNQEEAQAMNLVVLDEHIEEALRNVERYRRTFGGTINIQWSHER